MTPTCYCGAASRLVEVKGFPMYQCVNAPSCDGMTSQTVHGQPMGTMASAATRRERRRTHAAFDQLWRGGPFGTRGRAYRWLRGTLCTIRRRPVADHEAHIGLLGIEECRAVQEAVEARLAMGQSPVDFSNVRPDLGASQAANDPEAA